MHAARLVTTMLTVVLLLGAGGEAPASSWTDAEVRRIAARLRGELGSAAAVVDLFRLRELERDASDLPALYDAYLGAAWARRAPGEMRALARWRIAHVEWVRGRRPKARRWMRTLGMVSEVALAGPFPKASPGAASNPIAAALEAGEPLDLDARIDGVWPGLRWRTLSGIAPLGRIEVGPLIGPVEEATVYLRAVIESDVRQGAVLRLGTGGATRLWLRGQQRYVSKEERPARFDQVAVPVVLEAGRNEIVIEESGKRGALTLLLRITEADGDRLRGVRVLDPLLSGETGAGAVAHRTSRHRARRRGRRGRRATHLPAGPVVAPRPVTLRDLVASEVQAHPEDPLVHLAAALVARARPLRTTAEPAGRSELRAALARVDPEADPDLAAEVRWRLAEATRDESEARRLLEEAWAQDPRDPRVGMALAQRQLDAGQDDLALTTLRAVVDRTPSYIPAERLLASLEGRLLSAQAEARRLEALYHRFPSARAALLAWGRHLREEGRIAEAITVLRVAAALFPGDEWVTSPLIDLLLQHGDLDDALHLVEEQIAYDPGRPRRWIRLAELRSANGRPSAAGEAYARALALAPSRARSWIARARHDLRAGDREAAKEALARARFYSPQDPDIATLEPFLSEAPAAEDEAASLADAREVAERARSEGAPADASTWILEWQDLVEVHPSGLASRIHQEIHLVLDERGARELQHFSIAYEPDEQEVRVVRARVLRPDGSIRMARESGDRSLSEPWYRLYYDQRAREITFPPLSAGDVVEVVWRLDDVAETNWRGDAYGDLVRFQGPAPVRHRRYVLTLPKGKPLHASTLTLPGVRRETHRDAKGRVVRSWEAFDVPRITSEPHMPGWTEVAAFLHVSTYGSWGEVAAWWWDLVKDQLEPTPEIEDLAQALVEGIDPSDLEGRVRAVYTWVVRSTRYVGLELGVHGFKPYRVDEIHRRRFGDCKDKASLMFSLLRVLGIESRVVLVRTSDLGDLPDTPASPAIFNHAILYVPALDLWLDGTAEFSGTGELPWQDRGALVLVVDPHDPARSQLRHIPQARPQDNPYDETYRFEIAQDGSARFSGQLTLGGVHAPAMRRRLQAPDQREATLQRLWAQRYPGLELTGFSVRGVDRLDQPVRLEVHGRIPHLAQRSEGGLAVAWAGEDQGVLEALAPLERRVHPLVVTRPALYRTRVRFVLPPGQTPVLPEALEPLETPFGRFAERWTRTSDGAEVQIEFALEAGTIAPEAYPDFRRFLEAVDASLGATLVTTPAPAGPDAGGDRS